MNLKTSMAALAFALAATAPAMAQLVVRPVAGTLLTGGGEKLVTVQYSDGSTQSVRSGGIVQIFGGIEWQAMNGLDVQFNAGYHADDTSARNGSVRFTRYPVEALLLWSADERIRLGLGARKALGTRLSSSGAATSVIGSQDVGSKAGVVVQGEYLFARNYSVLLRYVNERYTFAGGATVSGSHGGLGLSVRF